MIIIQASQVMSMVHFTLVHKPWASGVPGNLLQPPVMLSCIDYTTKTDDWRHDLCYGLTDLVYLAERTLHEREQKDWPEVL